MRWNGKLTTEMSADPHVVLCAEPSIKALRHAIETLVAGKAASILVLATANDRWSPEAVEPVLNSCPIPIFGGVFPAIISGDQLLHEGTLLVGLHSCPEVSYFEGLSQERDQIAGMLTNSKFFDRDFGSLMVLIDSRRANAEFFIDNLYDQVGETVPVAGGGVGSLAERYVPNVFTNTGLVTDAALLVGFNSEAIQHSEHGWSRLDGPFVISSADGPMLHTLNHQSALQVYQDAIERCTSWRFSEHEFRTISSLFSLGIEQPCGSYLVRDPLTFDNNSLVCVGELPNGAIVHILTGQKDQLVSAAEHVSQMVVQERMESRSPEPALAIAWDCASRYKFLKEGFADELNAIAEQIPPTDHSVGALTLAEVANTNGGTIQLLNKSLVMVYH